MDHATCRLPCPARTVLVCATLPLKRLRHLEPAVINGAVNMQRACFYFWYYFPKPQAEEGVRAF